jgi:GntR family histidine utilization transcriptional repressor
VPGEKQIAEEFGCSRTTVNRAMRELAAAGFLDRRRKAGTRVALHPISRARLEIPVIRLEVEASGCIWSHSLLTRKICRPPLSVAAKMRSDPDPPMLFLRSLHFADAKPLLFEDRWINISILPEAAEVDFNAISANEWLVQNAAYTSGDMYFYAKNASGEHAEILETDIGSALLVAERITWNEAIAITAVRMHHAPDYRLRAAL